MILYAVCLFAGVTAALFFPYTIPPAWFGYVGVAILACLDSVLGGFKAQLQKSYDIRVFVSGFVGNALLAAAFVYMGNKLGLDLYLVAAVVFGMRLFQSFAEIRRMLLKFPPKSNILYKAAHIGIKPASMRDSASENDENDAK